MVKSDYQRHRNDRKDNRPHYTKLLDASSIEHYAESCPIEEINKAMVSKRGTGKKGFPEYLAISGDFVIVIEDKAKVEDQST